MSDEHATSAVWIILVFVFVVPVLVYAPLGASALEYWLLGTHHVYDFFDYIGLADPLDMIYRPVIDFFEGMAP